MADAGPNYTVERRRLELTKLEHAQTITKGNNRLSEIEQQKDVNLARAALANDELDDEAARIRANAAALKVTMGEIDKKLDLMTKESGNG